MRSSHSLDRLDTAFDDDRLVADAGLAAAGHPGPAPRPQGARRRAPRPGRRGGPGQRRRQAPDARACRRSRVATASMMPMPCGPVAPAGSWASRSRHPRPWARSCAASAGATCASSTGSAGSCSGGPGPPAPDPVTEPLTIDLDSTICETYGLKKEGARHHGYTGVRGYHPLLAVAAGTGDVLMARLREGRANTAPRCRPLPAPRPSAGSAHAGATGQLTMRADSGFYAHAVVAVCRSHGRPLQHHRAPAPRACAASSRPSPTRPGRPSPTGSRVGPTWPRPRYTPFADHEGRPARPAHRAPGEAHPGLPAGAPHRSTTTTPSSPTATATPLELEADHRRHAEIENAIRDLKYGVALNHLPSGRFAANGAWLAVQVMAHNVARWTSRIGLGAGIVTTKTLRRRLFGLPGRLTRSARRLTLHLRYARCRLGPPPQLPGCRLPRSAGSEYPRR